MKLSGRDLIAFLVAAVVFAGFLAEAAHDGIGISELVIRKNALIDADVVALICAGCTLFYG